MDRIKVDRCKVGNQRLCGFIDSQWWKGDVRVSEKADAGVALRCLVLKDPSDLVVENHERIGVRLRLKVLVVLQCDEFLVLWRIRFVEPILHPELNIVSCLEIRKHLIGHMLGDRALGEIGATLPTDAGLRWMESARARMMQGVTWGAERAPTAAIVEAIGDRMDEAARKRLNRWTAERQAIENELMGATEDWGARHERVEALQALNAQALKDLSESTRTPELLEQDFVMKANLKAMRDADPDDLRASFGGEDSDLGAMDRRMTARLTEMNDASDDGAAPETPAGAQEASIQAAQQRPLQRSQVNRLRDALGIPDEQRAVWDALVDDLMEASTALHESKALKASDMKGDPKEVMATIP